MKYLAVCLGSILLMTAPLAAQFGEEAKNKHLILEVNPVSHFIGYGGTVNGSLLFNGLSLNAEYQKLGGPYSTLDMLDVDIDGKAYTGSIGWYPQWHSYGYDNTVFFELGYGTLEMDYTDDFQDADYHINASGPMAKVGIRFILGMVTVSGAMNGHLYFSDVDGPEHEEETTDMYTGSFFMTYNVMMSFGIAI
ncbi:MAG: hypothetical protein ACOCWZ_09625 [Spirochaetota bacterium]